VAEIILTIPDPVVQRVLDGLVPEIPAGMTQGEAAKKVIIDFIKSAVRSTEVRIAAEAIADAEVT
jgi:hypothetical protein